jgi:hypothetical protein
LFLFPKCAETHHLRASAVPQNFQRATPRTLVKGEPWEGVGRRIEKRRIRGEGRQAKGGEEGIREEREWERKRKRKGKGSEKEGKGFWKEGEGRLPAPSEQNTAY